jgi:hypothetical protein
MNKVELMKSIYEIMKEYNDTKEELQLYLIENNSIQCKYLKTFENNRHLEESGICKDIFNLWTFDKDELLKDKKDREDEDLVNVSDISMYFSVNEIDISKEYYSSYLKMDKETFINKNIIWITPQLDQALTHVFEESRKIPEEPLIQPKIYKFKINKKVPILSSDDLNNYDIFKKILPPELEKQIKEKLEENGVPSFTSHNNLYILLIIIELNKFLSLDLKLYGYKNYNDQNELGLIHFNELIDTDSVIESNYIEATFYENPVDYYDKSFKPKQQNDKYPIRRQDYNPYTKYMDNTLAKSIAHSKGEEFNEVRGMHKRMVMTNRENKIVYQDFDDLTKNIEWSPPKIIDFYKLKYLKYKQKYLQYKQKYLQLKKKLNL